MGWRAGPSSHGHAADRTSISMALFDTVGGSGGNGSVGDEGEPSESETCATSRTHEMSGRVGSGSTRGIM
jgi:hypothetical protein